MFEMRRVFKVIVLIAVDDHIDGKASRHIPVDVFEVLGNSGAFLKKIHGVGFNLNLQNSKDSQEGDQPDHPQCGFPVMKIQPNNT